MPASTIGSAIAACLQFIVVLTIVLPIMTTHTLTGQGVAPTSFTANLINESEYLNSSFIAVSGQGSLQQQMSQIEGTSANAINPGILQTLGGLAFIPAAFGAFMNSLFNIPNLLNSLITSLFTNTGSVILPISVLAISGAFASYFVIIYVLKLLSPITKTQNEDL